MKPSNVVPPETEPSARVKGNPSGRSSITPAVNTTSTG